MSGDYTLKDIDIADGFSEKYEALLKEAQEADLSEVEKTNCVSKGTDADGSPVIVFVPRIGFGYRDKSEEIVHQMLLYFVKVADEVAEDNYSLVYSHINIHWLHRQPLIYRYYNLLPRKYKKNIKKIYMLNPQIGIKMFFEFSRVFLSDKFYEKLVYVDGVAAFQKLVPPNLLSLPLAFLCTEDEDRKLKPSGVSAELIVDYNPEIGTTNLMAQCTTFLREHGLKKVGLFRVAGVESQLRLVRVRIQPPLTATLEQKRAGFQCVVIGTENYNKGERVVTPVSEVNVRGSPSTGSDDATRHGESGKTPRQDAAPAVDQAEAYMSMSTVIVSDIDSVAQTLKLSLRDLGEPLFTFEAFDQFMELTKLLERSPKLPMDQWYTGAVEIMLNMPEMNRSSLAYLFDFLRVVASESETNNMDCSNLAIVFAPTLFRPKNPDMTNPAAAFNEVRLSQIIIKHLLAQPPEDRVFGVTTLLQEQPHSTRVLSSRSNMGALGAFFNTPSSQASREQDLPLSPGASPRLGGGRKMRLGGRGAKHAEEVPDIITMGEDFDPLAEMAAQGTPVLGRQGRDASGEKSKRGSAEFSLEDLKALQMQMESGAGPQDPPSHEKKDEEQVEDAPKLGTGEAYENLASDMMSGETPTAEESGDQENKPRSCDIPRNKSFDVTAAYGKNFGDDPPLTSSGSRKYTTSVPLAAQLEAEEQSSKAGKAAGLSSTDDHDDAEDVPTIVNAKEFTRKLSVERTGQA